MFLLLQDVPVPVLSARKVRFNQFASVEYQHEPYMTPRDFLFSVMLEKVDRKWPWLLCSSWVPFHRWQRQADNANANCLCH